MDAFSCASSRAMGFGHRTADRPHVQLEIVMPTYDDYLTATAKLISQNRRAGTHRVNILSREFLASSQVFSPRFFADTEIFAHHLPVSPGEEWLEIGCGIGAIGIFAALRGAKRVVLTDINRKAVQIAHENVRRHQVQDTIIEVRHGDLFRPIRDDEEFDTIFCNVPFGLVTKNHRLSILERAVFDPNYRFLRRFVAIGPRYLKPSGYLAIGFSTTLGKFGLLQRFCRMASLRLLLIYREKSKKIYPVNFELYEARK